MSDDEPVTDESTLIMFSFFNTPNKAKINASLYSTNSREGIFMFSPKSDKFLIQKELKAPPPVIKIGDSFYLITFFI